MCGLFSDSFWWGFLSYGNQSIVLQAKLYVSFLRYPLLLGGNLKHSLAVARKACVHYFYTFHLNKARKKL